MGRHRWLPAATPGGIASRPKTPRFRIALGAAFVVAGLCLGYGLVSLATADVSRSAAPILESIPLASEPAAGSPADEETKAEPPAPPSAASEDGAEFGDDPAGSGPVIIVHVAGAVGSPGIVRLADGSRVFEAIDAAGGATKKAQLEALNLAAQLIDGQQVFVPSPDAPGPPQPTADSGSGGGAGGSGGGEAEPGKGGAAGGPAAKININTATAEELLELPRVGPVLAARIVEFREQHGPYGQPSDLDAVPGIGPVMLEALVELVSV